MKNLFDTLEANKKRRTPFYKSDEFSFFMSNRGSLGKVPRFSFLDDIREDDFDIMRANIIIHSYLNKVVFEEEMLNFENYMKSGESIDHVKLIQTLRERMIDLPYFKEENEKDKIYIPFFSRALNQSYLNEPEKFLVDPYKGLKDNFKDTLVDPFDTYGSEIYNSHFSRLVKIASVDKETAFFHYDTNTIYFVNEQGRLDASIVLFDKYIRHPNYSHMLERIRPVVDSYFSFDRDGLVNNLYDNGFISAHLLHRIKFHDWAKL